jgi:hypothetical protein
MDIPIKIYLYLIIFIIILILCVGIYLFIKPDTSLFMKTFIIWYTIILEVNFIHLYFILDFYEKHKNKKGIKGPSGDVGVRGFKGNSQQCESCGPTITTKYAGTLNDKGFDVSKRDMVVGGKCNFPFVDNYQHQYKCIKTKTPDGEEDATLLGWCATEVNNKNEVVKYGYCNENDTMNNELKRNKQMLDNREKYLNNNYGILDIDVVQGNTENDAKKHCDRKGQGYNIVTNNDDIEQDLNEGVDGKFIYMCYKDGYGNLGVNELIVGSNEDVNMPTDMSQASNIDLNANSKGESIAKLYLYKKTNNENFIKDLKILKGEQKCDAKLGPNYFEIHDNLNEGDPNLNNKLVLCGSRTIAHDNIDMAFVYKTGRLYIFRDDKFFKMSNKPIQNSLTTEDGYPKDITERWFKSGECSRFNDNKKECNEQAKCVYNSEKSVCRQIKYSAAFTYGYDNNVYFFQGSNVYLYDDKHMRVADGYPKPINEVFKGIPNNIDAVFTWGKDGATYFFKDKLYYKYNDKNKKVESGYPRESKSRWIGMPSKIDAIFTLKVSLDDNDNYPTYIIHGGETSYIDPITEQIEEKNTKKIDERFKGLYDISILPEETTTTPTTITTTIG